MSNLYDAENKRVLLARFPDSQMVADNQGKATSSLQDFWRTKTYVKPEEMLNAAYPIFRQPYSWASSMFGGTWNDYNRVFVIQLPKCNLNCWYCYVDPALRQGLEFTEGDKRVGQWVSIEELYSEFLNSDTGLLRISGGEPMLAPEFVIDMVHMVGNQPVWVDTNMSTGKHFFDVLNEQMPDYDPFASWDFGMCGCFKGFTDQQAAVQAGVIDRQRKGSQPSLLDAQFAFAKWMVDAPMIAPFWYVPDLCVNTTREDVRQFFERMRMEVDDCAPLRTHILHIKEYTPTDHDQAWKLGDCQRTVDTKERPIDIWRELCECTYPPGLVWIPSDQVPLASRAGSN